MPAPKSEGGWTTTKSIHETVLWNFLQGKIPITILDDTTNEPVAVLVPYEIWRQSL